MYIRADDNGIILLVSKYDNQDCENYIGEKPDDFFSMIGFGKYKFIDGQILPVENWILPKIDDTII